MLKLCFFNHTIKASVVFESALIPCVSSTGNLTVSVIPEATFEVRVRVPFQLKKPFKGPRPKKGCWKGCN